MSETALTIWVLVVFAVIMNGCAGGAAAILHGRRGKWRRGARIVIAAAASGLLSTSMFLPWAWSDAEWGNTNGALIIGFALAAILVVATVISLPGALVVSRRLDAPGDDYRAFE